MFKFISLMIIFTQPLFASTSISFNCNEFEKQEKSVFIRKWVKGKSASLKINNIKSHTTYILAYNNDVFKVGAHIASDENIDVTAHDIGFIEIKTRNLRQVNLNSHGINFTMHKRNNINKTLQIISYLSKIKKSDIIIEDLFSKIKDNYFTKKN